MKKALLLLHLFLFLSVNTCLASTYYVNKTATGTGSGTSWANAFTTLEAAFTTAIVGDQIWVAAGVYKPTGVTYNIPNGLKVYGGFAGTETALAERDLTVNTTTLNGDIGAVGTPNDNCTSVVTMTNTSNLNIFDGFKIINGYNDTSGMGGAIKVSGGSATIKNCEFIANYGFNGACIGYSGTGILNIVDCKMTNNNAIDGGAIFVSSGSVFVKGCTIQSNIASDYGGAIYSEFGLVTVDRCDVSGNTAEDLGGAFYAGSTAQFEIYNSLIAGNLSEDKAVLYMAPISNENTHKIINCTISGNRNTDTTSSTSSIITLSYSGNCPFYNNIMWNNTATIQLLNGVVKKCFINGTIVATSTSGLSTANPGLTTIGIPSAAPFTTEGYDYHLNQSSPAVNYGTNSYINPLYNLDRDGNGRIFGTNVDAGAYESQVLDINDFKDIKVTYFYQPGSKSIVFFKNASLLLNKEIYIYDFSGRLLITATITSDAVPLNLPSQAFYIAKVEGAGSLKFFVK